MSDQGWYYIPTIMTSGTTFTSPNIPNQAAFIAQTGPPRKKESAVDWLRRRVDEVTNLVDLAA